MRNKLDPSRKNCRKIQQIWKTDVPEQLRWWYGWAGNRASIMSGQNFLLMPDRLEYGNEIENNSFKIESLRSPESSHQRGVLRATAFMPIRRRRDRFDEPPSMPIRPDTAFPTVPRTKPRMRLHSAKLSPRSVHAAFIIAADQNTNSPVVDDFLKTELCQATLLNMAICACLLLF
jgi:hypothetical protein